MWLVYWVDYGMGINVVGLFDSEEEAKRHAKGDYYEILHIKVNKVYDPHLEG